MVRDRAHTSAGRQVGSAHASDRPSAISHAPPTVSAARIRTGACHRGVNESLLAVVGATQEGGLRSLAARP
jgi:hypothetical protein